MIWLVGALAWAQSTVDITIDPEKAAALGIDPSAAEADLEAAIEEELNVIDQSGFLRSMADAAGIAGKGIGVDYATNPKAFVVGFSLGTGANASGLVFGRGQELLPEAGFAFQASAMAGVNLGILTPGEEPDLLDRIVLSANGMAFNGARREFQGSMFNLGVHAQVKVIGKKGEGLFEWGGLDVTSGVELTRYRLKLTRGFPLSTTSSGVTLTWDAVGDGAIRVGDQSVPIELSTNLRVSVITLFLGAGADWHSGAARSSVSVAGPITGSTDSATEELGTATVSLDDSGASTPLSGRGFLGVQVNVLPVKLYAQVNVATSAGIDDEPTASVGAHAGLRVAM